MSITAPGLFGARLGTIPPAPRTPALVFAPVTRVQVKSANAQNTRDGFFAQFKLALE
jgi:hypothetical protein